MKNKAGFTLVELLVTTAILSTLAVVTTNILFDTVTTRSKQYSIAASNEESRYLINEITKSIQEAQSVDIPDSATLELRGVICKTYHFNSLNYSVEIATDSSANCVAPTTGFAQITSGDLTVNNLNFSPIGSQVENINLNINGFYKNSNSEHNFDYSTTVFSRLSI